MQRRNTDQKRVVLQCIDELGHVTMEQLIQMVHEKDLSISISTIYRNVSVLLAEKLVKKFKINQVEVYETVKAKHYHFLCKECGNIFDLDTGELDKRLFDLFKIEGNKIEDIEIYFSGICRNCLKKEEV